MFTRLPATGPIMRRQGRILSKMSQTNIDPELLITLIESRPIIWDKTLENYKDTNLRTAAWREVCIVLREDFQEMEERERH
jgi:hypothetical protein